jgi:hypothetical protein
MSCYWDLHCWTCNVGVGLHANHADAGITELAVAAPRFAAAAKILRDDRIFIDVREWSIWRINPEHRDRIPLTWFLKHEGHDLAPRNERGNRMEEE